jgi:hypothetical protein
LKRHVHPLFQFKQSAAGGVVAAAPVKVPPQHPQRCCISASLKLPPSISRIMSSASFWSDACNNAIGKPLQTLLNALNVSCGVTVRPARAAACVLLAAV